MLYNEKQIRTIINNAVTTAGIDSAIVNGKPVGLLDEYTDFTRYGNLLLQPAVSNQFINALYNQFIYRATRENFFSSPFDRFRERREGVAYGEYETDVQPIFPVPYDMKAFDRILDFWETPVVVQYFAINRRDTFPQTIVKEMLKDAFTSYGDFDSFLARLIMAPRKGNIVIETNAVKQVINRNVASGAVKTIAMTTPANPTEDYYKALASDIVGYASAMTAEPSKEFNNFSQIEGSNGQEVWAQSDRRDLVLIGDSTLIAKLRTYVLAFAFNKDEIDFNFDFVTVNSFDYSLYNNETRAFGESIESPIKLILCDGGWIKFEDNLDEEFSNTNAMTMGIQRALQVQQTIGIRAYRNALAWVEVAEGEGGQNMVFDTEQTVFYPSETNPSITVSTKGTENSTNISVKSAYIGQLGGEQTKVELTYDDLLQYVIVGYDYEITNSFIIQFIQPYVGTSAGDLLTVTFDLNGSEIVVVIPTTTGE